MSKFLKTLLIAGVAFVAIYAVAMQFLFPSIKESNFLESPDHKYVAAILFEDSGALNSNTFGVRVFKKNHFSLPPWRKTVFVVNGWSSIQATWKEKNVLSVAGECDPLEITTQENNFGEIKVQYALKKKNRFTVAK